MSEGKLKAAPRWRPLQPALALSDRTRGGTRGRRQRFPANERRNVEGAQEGRALSGPAAVSAAGPGAGCGARGAGTGRQRGAQGAQRRRGSGARPGAVGTRPRGPGVRAAGAGGGARAQRGSWGGLRADGGALVTAGVSGPGFWSYTCRSCMWPLLTVYHWPSAELFAKRANGF